MAFLKFVKSLRIVLALLNSLVVLSLCHVGVDRYFLLSKIYIFDMFVPVPNILYNFLTVIYANNSLAFA